MREEQKERALLLGVKLNDGEDFKKSMEELAALSEACGMEVVGADYPEYGSAATCVPVYGQRKAGRSAGLYAGTSGGRADL